MVAAAQRHGILAAGFAGTPANAQRLRAHGIQCLAVTTDVAVVAEGSERCSRADDEGARAPERAPGDSPRQGEAVRAAAP